MDYFLCRDLSNNLIAGSGKENLLGNNFLRNIIEL